jgi:hypothetical protein
MSEGRDSRIEKALTRVALSQARPLDVLEVWPIPRPDSTTGLCVNFALVNSIPKSGDMDRFVMAMVEHLIRKGVSRRYSALQFSLNRRNAIGTAEDSDFRIVRKYFFDTDVLRKLESDPAAHRGDTLPTDVRVHNL